MKKFAPHIKDEMTPIERMKAMDEGKQYDRIPCVPLLGEPSTRLIGTTISEYWHSAKLLVEAEAAAFSRFGHDSVGVGPSAYGVAEAMGAHVVYPDDNIPYISSPLITDYSMLDGMEPLNPHSSERMITFLHALEILKEVSSDVVGAGFSIAGPFTIASYLRGVDNILKDVYKNPEELHKLMQLVTESCNNCIAAASVFDIGVGFADPLASGTVIGPNIFKEFVKPYIEQMIETAYKKTGNKPSIHMCGNTYSIWKYLAEFDISSLSIDNMVDIGRAKDEVGNKVCIMGNIDPTGIFMMGNKESIFSAVKECIKKAGDSPKGLILSSGCQIPVNAPMENVDYFMEAARTVGKKL